MEKEKRWRPDGTTFRAAAASLGIYLLLLALAAYLTLRGRVGEEHMRGAAQLCAAIAAFAGTALCVRRGVPSALLSTALFGGTTVLLGVLLCDDADAANVLPLLLAMLLGMLPALLLRRRGRGKRKRRPPRRST